MAKYTKISPFDFYLLLEKKLPEARSASHDSVYKDLVKEVGQVTISLSGPGVLEPYSYTQPLIEFDGVTYLRASTIPPSEEAMARFVEPWAEMRALQEKLLEERGPVVVTYSPESDDVEVQAN